MDADVSIDKDKFDALLRKLINSEPLPYQDAVSIPKLRKDGSPKRSQVVRKTDE